MLQTGSYSQPNIAVPESQKDENYYRSFALSIVNGSLTDTYANNYLLMAELIKFYESGSSGELTKFLQETPDGQSIPAYWTTINGIRPKLHLLKGELEARGYEIHTKATNKEAYARKIEEKERLRVERRLRNNPSVQEAIQMTGIPLFAPEYIPQTDAELDDYVDLSFKDKVEIIMDGALRWIAKRNHWDEQRAKMFMDVWLNNRAICRTEIVRGIPRSVRVNPLQFIFDPRSTDDMLSDSTYFGEVIEMPLSEAAERYNLSFDELNEVRNSYLSYLGNGVMNNPEHAYGFGSIGTDRWQWFRTPDSYTRVLVIRCVWKDIKELNHKNEVNEKYGTEHLQKLDNIREKDKDKIITTKMDCWRQCTIIGGQILREYGEVPNQPRDLNDIGQTECPYKVWIPNYYNSRPVSVTEQLVGLQLYKDIAMYNLQVQLSTSGGQGMFYDMAYIPEGYTIENIISFAKTSKIVPVNSKEMQLQSGTTSLFKEWDLSVTNTINQYITVLEMLDRQMDSISGVSPEREGVVMGSSQAVGVTNAAISQSNLITEPYFSGFERFCSRVLTYQAKLVKIAWAGKEVFAPIIGDVGIDFLKEHIDMEFESFDVFIESLPPMLRDRDKFEQFLNIAIQSQQISMEDALSILLESDLKVAVRKYQRKVALRKRLDMQQQQAQAQQEQQMAQEQMQMQQQQLQQESQLPLQLQQMKNQGNLEKTLVTSRTKLNGQKLDLLKQ